MGTSNRDSPGLLSRCQTGTRVRRSRLVETAPVVEPVETQGSLAAVEPGVADRLAGGVDPGRWDRFRDPVGADTDLPVAGVDEVVVEGAEQTPVGQVGRSAPSPFEMVRPVRRRLYLLEISPTLRHVQAGRCPNERTVRRSRRTRPLRPQPIRQGASTTGRGERQVSLGRPLSGQELRVGEAAKRA